MRRCRVRSAWLCRCWRMYVAAVFTVMCSRPGMVLMVGVGGGLRMSRNPLGSPSCLGIWGT